VLDRTNSEGLLTKLWKVSEEGLDVVLCLVRANRIHNIRLLISLPLLETTYITRLKEVGLVGGKLDYLDLIHLRLKDKVISVMTCCTIN
jgi:hypothetical protein